MIELLSASTGPATLIVVGGHSSGIGKTSVI